MEQKTKPTQQSINLLQSRGLFPDIIVARGPGKLTRSSLEKIALFSNLRDDRVFSIPDVESIYQIPEILRKQKFDTLLYGKLGIDYTPCHKYEIWKELLHNELHQKITIGIVGKYTALEDSYSSVVEAVKHAGIMLGTEVKIIFIDTRKKDGIELVKKCDGCIVPGGFGDIAIENIITTLSYIRENKIPCLGICLGLQLMSIEYARNILGNSKANSLEFDKKCSPNDIITLLDSQKNIVNLGGTMRLGKQKSKLKKGIIYDVYKSSGRLSEKGNVHERFRHRFEVNPVFAKELEVTEFHISGRSTMGIVQFIELDVSQHPYYVATQSHPELTSKLEDPAPLFIGLLQASTKK